ncbi:citrate lyase acyl carrier protein [Erysipelothrix inopinata]|uniref:Citrate lyase acyl carrier protein n=1 Tax=Erysipelothrix inopinata TaxID=225084 RepID=A0A7G9RWL6_9FIRM|nr:citrate lyase acyl carrier protein [Erysipelothrix inopinata]QNN59991.1 citrate lyase acyl carrier protein [Erysipelothrix inopinata]
MTKFEIKNPAVAGTLESSDLQIMIDSNEGKGIEIDLQSSVEFQFGKQIRKVVLETLANMGVTDAKVSIVDKGALDCTIKARTIAVVHRAAGQVESINWEEIETWNV